VFVRIKKLVAIKALTLHYLAHAQSKTANLL
jgi:hypothetical protein